MRPLRWAGSGRGQCGTEEGFGAAYGGGALAFVRIQRLDNWIVGSAARAQLSNAFGERHWCAVRSGSRVAVPQRVAVRAVFILEFGEFGR